MSVFAALVYAPTAGASATTFSGVGGTNISGGAVTAMNAFEAGIGGANNGTGGAQANGFRTVNWDGVPDAFADPSVLPGSYYNATSPRGLVLATPGSAMEVSGSAAPAVGFGDINSTYPSAFPAFSPARVFSPIGSNVTDLTFYAAGTPTRATVAGLGAIFRNVEVANSSSIEYFDQAGHSLGKFFAPVGTKAQPEFLGVLFSPERVARAEITSGTVALGPNDNPPTTNVTVLDDFAFAEPQALPSPTLTISSPSESAVVSEAQLTVAGSVTDSTGIAALTVNGSVVAVAPDGSWAKQLTLSPGPNAIAVLATNADGNSAQALRAVTYAPPVALATLTQAAIGQTPTVSLPIVSMPTLAPARFPAAPSGPSAVIAKRRYGTNVSYTLNETASVRFTVTHVVLGRRAGRQCVKATKLNRRAPTCKRAAALSGSFSLAAKAGTNRFHFAGRLSGRKLAVGRYSLVATPSAGGKTGQAASASFQIIK